MPIIKELSKADNQLQEAELITPRTAIKKAMEHAVNELTKGLDFEKIDPSVFEKKLENITAGRCLEGCLIAASFLHRNHSELFKTIALLHYEKFETTKQNKPIGVFHEYFLIRDNAGIWHAASPANHERYSGENSRLKRFFSSDNLRGVLNDIEKFEGGAWPTEQYIVDVLKRRKSPLVTYEGKAEVIQFVKENTGNEYELTKCIFPIEQPPMGMEF